MPYKLVFDFLKLQEGQTVAIKVYSSKNSCLARVAVRELSQSICFRYAAALDIGEVKESRIVKGALVHCGRGKTLHSIKTTINRERNLSSPDRRRKKDDLSSSSSYD